MQEMWVWFLGLEDPLQKEMATHSSILAWEIPWTEVPGRLQFTGSQPVRHNLVTKDHQEAYKFTHTITKTINTTTITFET